MVQNIQEFMAKLEAMESIEQIQSILKKTLTDLGFEAFAYHILCPPEGSRETFLISSYPEHWQEHYFNHDYINVDPLISMTSSTVMPIVWHDVITQKVCTEEQKKCFYEAGEYGLRNGVSIPIHGPAHGLALMSVAHPLSSQKSQEIWQCYRHELQLIAFYTHSTVLNKIYPQKSKIQNKLSPRERECLLWTSRGKTAWEISEILGITENTVVEHIKHAMKKFGVFSKNHAVVRAIMLGMIIP